MKKLLPFFLLFSAGFVHADWTPIASSLNDPKLFIDPDSIKTTILGRPQVYHIANYAQIQNKDGKLENKPVDYMNHSIDAIRYVCLNLLDNVAQGKYSFM
jgi:hypothetical protein